MTDCKKAIITMIDEAVERNGRESGCTCQHDIGKTPMCAYCTNKEALRVARACIVSSADRMDAMFALWSATQCEIEERLNRGPVGVAVCEIGHNGEIQETLDGEAAY